MKTLHSPTAFKMISEKVVYCYFNNSWASLSRSDLFECKAYAEAFAANLPPAILEGIWAALVLTASLTRAQYRAARLVLRQNGPYALRWLSNSTANVFDLLACAAGDDLQDKADFKRRNPAVQLVKWNFKNNFKKNFKKKVNSCIQAEPSSAFYRLTF